MPIRVCSQQRSIPWWVASIHGIDECLKGVRMEDGLSVDELQHMTARIAECGVLGWLT
jgi:hypothetical protein